MNRDGVNRLKRVVRAYDYSIRLADSSFRKEIEEMKDEEEQKVENLPESLQSSQKAEALEEAAEMLESLLDNAESILDTLDEILSTSSVSSSFTSAARETAAGSTDRKDVRFQALLSSSLFAMLKEEAAQRGLSMNEIVGRALTKELLVNCENQAQTENRLKQSIDKGKTRDYKRIVTR